MCLNILQFDFIEKSYPTVSVFPVIKSLKLSLRLNDIKLLGLNDTKAQFDHSELNTQRTDGFKIYNHNSHIRSYL